MTMKAPGSPGTSIRDEALGRGDGVRRIAPGDDPWTVES
jgi:hypothetical protein